MELGTIGAGAFAQAFAKRALNAGHTVKLSNDQGPDSLREIVTRLGPRSMAVPKEVAAGAVRELVGIESGVVSGLSNPNDSGVATPVETTPWEAITRSLPHYIRQLGRAPNFLTTGSTRLKWVCGRRCGALSRA